MAQATPTPAEIFNSPHIFADLFLKILDKRKELIPLRYNHVQRLYLANRSRRDLILKARQFGISTCIQAEFFRKVTTSSAATMTLSHEDESTQKLRRIVDRFYNNLPKDFRPARQYSNSRLATYPDFDSEAIIATAGNRNAGRGGTYTHLHASEVAFYTDAQAIISGAMQGGNPYVVLESTPNGAQGYFYTLCMEALDGNNAWKLHFYPWWYSPEYAVALDEDETLTYTDDEQLLIQKHGLTAQQIKWRRGKQKELKDQFGQEYPEDPKKCFLLSGLGYFGDLSNVYKAPFNPVYQEGHRYVAGLDWGQSNDYTVLSIGDATIGEQVELLRINKMAWAEMRRRIRERCQYWHVSVLWAEANSMGTTNIEALMTEFDGADTAVNAFDTNNASKAFIMGNFHDALENNVLKLLPDSDQERELSAFRSIQLPSGIWRLAAPDNEHDDIVIADALMWHGVVNSGQVGRVASFDW